MISKTGELSAAAPVESPSDPEGRGYDRIRVTVGSGKPHAANMPERTFNQREKGDVLKMVIFPSKE